jgi:hypothetical protein
MKRIQTAILTLYADLLQQLQATSVLPGSVRTQEVKGKLYLKANTTIGGHRRTIHIGCADDPDAVEKARAIDEEMQRAKARRQVVGLLRRAGMPSPSVELGRVLEALAAAELFRNGAVLVGTAAYQCYSPMVGMVLPAASMMTQDVDLAIGSVSLSAGGRNAAADVDHPAKQPRQTLEDILRRADPTFSAAPDLGHKSPPSRFRANSGFLVDLITPVRNRNQSRAVPIPGLQAGATPLQHLSWLIADPSPAAVLYGPGFLVQVPQPARYAVHKLLIAQKRPPGAAKRSKDLSQAKSLIEALTQSEPYAVKDALDDARGQGIKGWKRPIDRSIAELGLEDELRDG